MRLLDRYVTKELLTWLGYCLGGFLIFWIAFDLLSELESFQKDQLRLQDIVEYYVVITPKFMVVVLPVTLLLAMLFNLTSMARHHEIIAMRAAGIGIWRICTPHLVLGLLFSLVLFGINEWWTPDSEDIAREIRGRRLATEDNPIDRHAHPNLTFANQRDNRKWFIGLYRSDRQEMKDVRIQWTLEDGRYKKIVAEQAVWTNSQWTFHNAVTWNHYGAIPFPVEDDFLVITNFTETPEEIKSEIKVGALTGIQAARRPQLSLKEILDYQRLNPRMTPEKLALLKTQFYGRIAEPWTCLVVVLIAIPFGAASGRRNLFAGVASSIFISFSYFILQRFGLALGTSGALWPWLAAWLPNLAFGSIGIWLTRKLQ